MVAGNGINWISNAKSTDIRQQSFAFYEPQCGTVRGKTTESDRHPYPTTNPNLNPYLVVGRYSSLAQSALHDNVPCH